MFAVCDVFSIKCRYFVKSKTKAILCTDVIYGNAENVDRCAHLRLFARTIDIVSFTSLYHSYFDWSYVLNGACYEIVSRKPDDRNTSTNAMSRLKPLESASELDLCISARESTHTVRIKNSTIVSYQHGPLFNLESTS